MSHVEMKCYYVSKKKKKDFLKSRSEVTFLGIIIANVRHIIGTCLEFFGFNGIFFRNVQLKTKMVPSHD